MDCANLAYIGEHIQLNKTKFTRPNTPISKLDNLPISPATPPCGCVYSVGAESECFRWISRENHFSLIAVGSERLCSHSLQFKPDWDRERNSLVMMSWLQWRSMQMKLVTSGSCHDYLPFLRVWNQSFGIWYASFEFKWVHLTAAIGFSLFRHLWTTNGVDITCSILIEWVPQIELSAMHLTVQCESCASHSPLSSDPAAKSSVQVFFCNLAARYPPFVLRSMNSDIRLGPLYCPRSLLARILTKT